VSASTPIRSWLAQFAVAAAVMGVLDAVWLGLVAASLYDEQLGALRADEVNGAAAGAFYLVYVAGLVHFVTAPALAHKHNLAVTARQGALLGVVAYATWDLTNLAVIEGFPAALVPVDLTWGAILSATVCTVTVLALRRVGSARED
jgi:uncharacterized membrane protein